MRRISRHSSSVNNFVIQSGIRLGDMASELDSKYSRAMAHGTCPWVGWVPRIARLPSNCSSTCSLGGHAGFGGWGLASRNWGLVIDQVLNMSFNLPSPNVLTVIAQVIAAELVQADGTVVNVSATERPELYWVRHFSSPRTQA
jgi:FAD/FMN-containing dehydrogenase